MILDFCFQAITTQMKPKDDFWKPILNFRTPIVCSPDPGNFFKPVEAWSTKLQVEVIVQIYRHVFPICNWKYQRKVSFYLIYSQYVII